MLITRGSHACALILMYQTTVRTCSKALTRVYFILQMRVLNLTHAWTTPDTRVPLPTHNGSICLHMCVRLHTHAHVCKIASKRYRSYLAMKLLVTYSIRNNGYYLCLFMQTQFQLGSYNHTCTNETHSLANLQDKNKCVI